MFSPRVAVILSDLPLAILQVVRINKCAKAENENETGMMADQQV